MTAIPRVLVLMTTYNGEDYLREQLESITAQEDVDVTLRIADDYSTDATRSILEDYAAAHSNVQLVFNSHNKGVVENFLGLVYAAPADDYDYFAIADQDDVWLPEKLHAAVAHMDAGYSGPQLYYAGVENVDVAGNVLGNEYAPYVECARHPASLLLVQNWCLGCTSLMNGALVRLLQEHPVYDVGRMYDAWIHAVALYCGGRVVCDLEHSYIRRRITGKNTVGIMNERRSPLYLAGRALGWLAVKDEEVAAKHTRMAATLYREYHAHMQPETAQLVFAVARREQSAAARRLLFAHADYAMTTLPRSAWLRLAVLLNRF